MKAGPFGMMKKTYISVLSIFIYVTKKEQTCKNID
jgi:hypothetical protein